MTPEEILNQGLPKWPQMLVTGLPVSVAQAKEIIRRTDTFFHWSGGNNREYNRLVRKKLHMPADFFDLGGPAITKMTDAERKAHYDEEHRLAEIWQEKWQLMESTEYVHNSWISNAFVGGPHGWCHPDGNIGFIDNVGKWPSGTHIFHEWQLIAATFPFLHIGVTLFDKEQCEDNSNPVMSFAIDLTNVVPSMAHDAVHEGHAPATRRAGAGDHLKDFMRDWGNPRRELGIEDAWIDEWAAHADKLFGKLEG